METAIASNVVSIDITLIWTVIASMASVIGLLGTAIGILFTKLQVSNKNFSDALLHNATSMLEITKDNTHALEKLSVNIDQNTRTMEKVMSRS